MYTIHCPDWCDPWPGDLYDTLEEATDGARYYVKMDLKDSGRVTVFRMVPVCRVEMEVREVDVTRDEEVGA